MDHYSDHHPVLLLRQRLWRRLQQRLWLWWLQQLRVQQQLRRRLLLSWESKEKGARTNGPRPHFDQNWTGLLDGNHRKQMFFLKKILQFFVEGCMIGGMNKADGPPIDRRNVDGKRGPAGFVVRPFGVYETGHAAFHSGRAPRLGKLVLSLQI